MEIVRKRPLGNELQTGTAALGNPKKNITTSDNYPQPNQPYLVNSVTEDEDDKLELLRDLL